MLKAVLKLSIFILISLLISACSSNENSLSELKRKAIAPNDYNTMKVWCAKNLMVKSCCLKSVSTMEKFKYLMTPSGSCGGGYIAKKHNCPHSYTWCEPPESDKPKDSQKYKKYNAFDLDEPEMPDPEYVKKKRY